MAAPGQRLKGQEVSIRILQNGTLLSSIDSVSSFNEEVDLEIKSDGFLGEPVNRFDEILNGFGGDFEMQTTNGSWLIWQQAIIARAQRVASAVGTTFNVVRTDLYENGDSNVYTYVDAKWGGMPSTVGARGEYVKVKASFKCSTRPVLQNQI
jgi:hypothetical protein